MKHCSRVQISFALDTNNRAMYIFFQSSHQYQGKILAIFFHECNVIQGGTKKTKTPKKYSENKNSMAAISLKTKTKCVWSIANTHVHKIY